MHFPASQGWKRHVVSMLPAQSRQMDAGLAVRLSSALPVQACHMFVNVRQTTLHRQTLARPPIGSQARAGAGDPVGAHHPAAGHALGAADGSANGDPSRPSLWSIATNTSAIQHQRRGAIGLLAIRGRLRSVQRCFFHNVAHAGQAAARTEQSSSWWRLHGARGSARDGGMDSGEGVL